MKIEDLTLLEAIIALKYGFINLGREIKRSIFNEIDKIIFLFSKPKYKVYQNIKLWDKYFLIVGIYKDWNTHHYCYKLWGTNLDISEGLIDFYQKT